VPNALGEPCPNGIDVCGRPALGERRTDSRDWPGPATERLQRECGTEQTKGRRVSIVRPSPSACADDAGSAAPLARSQRTWGIPVRRSCVANAELSLKEVRQLGSWQ